MRRRYVVVYLPLTILACCVTNVRAQVFCEIAVPHQVFCDEFSDMSVTNNIPIASDGITPLHWTPRPGFPGDYDATVGDYVLASTGNDMASHVLDFDLSDTSIRSRVRSSAINGAAQLGARNQELTSAQNYFGGTGYFPNEGGTILFLGRSDGPDNQIIFGGGDFPVLPFDVRTQDAMLQLDVIGNELRLWGWKAGDPMPDEPQLVAIDDTYTSGSIRILNSSGRDDDNVATFRFVQVATAPIPEPSTALLACFGFLSLLAWRPKKPVRSFTDGH